MLAHAASLLAGSPQVATQYIDGDLRDASVILRAAGTLDFTRPVALMLVRILHLIQDSEEPHGIVAGLMDALPSGSYLAISHPASDINASQAEAQRRYNERVSTPQTLRARDEVTRFFEGLDLVPPGVVYVHAWRPDPGGRPPEGGVSAYGGVARKP
ncbi:MAG TPA: SAM-dependent methyltransferase [Streptosporangiaceae bacterium]|nr:SAM-dependent methyltransferase [Streptosporangiaceae bacterium]